MENIRKVKDVILDRWKKSIDLKSLKIKILIIIIPLLIIITLGLMVYHFLEGREVVSYFLIVIMLILLFTLNFAIKGYIELTVNIVVIGLGLFFHSISFYLAYTGVFDGFTIISIFVLTPIYMIMTGFLSTRLYQPIIMSVSSTIIMIVVLYIFPELLKKFTNNMIITSIVGWSSLLPSIILAFLIFYVMKKEKGLIEEIRNSNNKLSVIFNNNSNPQLLLRITDDKSFKIDKVNNAYIEKAMTIDRKLSKEQLIGLDIEEIGNLLRIDRSIIDYTIDYYNQVLYSKKAVKYEEKILFNNEMFYNKVTLIPIIEDNECKFILYNSNDVTEHIVSELKLKEYSDKLKSSNEMLESFSYNVSHDLKNAVSNIISALRIINRKYSSKSEEDKEILSTTIDKANKIAQYITDLLNYSKLDARKDFEVINLEDVLLDYDRKIVDIYYEKLPKIYGIKSLLNILFQNLISNAVKYCDKDKPKIVVSVNDKDTEWLISVKDNGIGINEKDKDKIFGMMYRVKSIKNDYEGTGIGLASCRKIVEIHGGKIWVESTPGEGSTFFFTIPKNIDTND